MPPAPDPRPAPASIVAPLEIFLVAPPGLEAVLLAEAQEHGFKGATAVPGGVTVQGGWPEVWRANLMLRGAGRVLARIAEFRALHLAQLDKRARRVPWADVLRPDVPVRVDATCRASRIYHAGAAASRIARAIREELGAPVTEGGKARPAESAPDTPENSGTTPDTPPPIVLKARIEDDLCTLSIDTSGAPLHQRGLKLSVGKAPLRETLAALFLRQAGFRGTEPVIDPMCGSGTFVLEAAEIALGTAPGRARPFAFEALAPFDAALWTALRDAAVPSEPAPPLLMRGYDRDAGAVARAIENAARAGLSDITAFTRQPISDLARPPGPPGLIAVNPPYGGRIGQRKLLFALYDTLGRRLRAEFSGWRVALVTSDPGLAKSTGLPFGPSGAPVPHGGLRIRLYTTGPLP